MVTELDREPKREQKMLKGFYSALFGTVLMSCLWLNGNFYKVIERRDRLKTQHRVRRGIPNYIYFFSLKWWTCSANLKALVALQDMDLKEGITKVHVSAIKFQLITLLYLLLLTDHRFWKVWKKDFPFRPECWICIVCLMKIWSHVLHVTMQ